MNKSRMEAFSDGVFAIAITILILGLKIPIISQDKLVQVAFDQFPKFLAFILSFIIIGTYWVAHHSMVHFIKKVDRASLWLNLIILLFVCFLPYPTGMLGEYPFNRFTVILYAISLSCVNIAGTIFWIYSTSLKENALEVSKEYRKFLAMLHMSPVLLYTLAIIFTFISMIISYMIFVIVPVFFIFIPTGSFSLHQKKNKILRRKLWNILLRKVVLDVMWVKIECPRAALVLFQRWNKKGLLFFAAPLINNSDEENFIFLLLRYVPNQV